MKKRSFTLIEMLIVIVIIGILAAALVPRLQSVQARARDTKRKTDLRNIATANEVYRLDVGTYARAGNLSLDVNGYVASTGAAYVITGTTIWIIDLTGVMTSIPVDPINNSYRAWDNNNYSYYYGAVLRTCFHTYDLGAKLENSRDPDRNAVKNYLYSENNCTHSAWAPFNADGRLYEYSPYSNSF